MRDRDLPEAGPDILLALDDYPDMREQMTRERAEQQENLLSPRLPRRHYAKVDTIPLPPALEEWDWSTGGVLLWGPRGTGKTQAACRMAVEAVRSGEVAANRVAWISTSKLYMDLRRAIDDKSVKVPEISLMQEADMVCIDDLGKERPSDWVMEQNFVLFDTLYARDVRLVVATNYQPQELFARTGEFAADRIMEMTKPIHMGGQSHRSTNS